MTLPGSPNNEHCDVSMGVAMNWPSVSSGALTIELRSISAIFPFRKTGLTLSLVNSGNLLPQSVYLSFSEEPPLPPIPQWRLFENSLPKPAK